MKYRLKRYRRILFEPLTYPTIELARMRAKNIYELEVRKTPVDIYKEYIGDEGITVREYIETISNT